MNNKAIDIPVWGGYDRPAVKTETEGEEGESEVWNLGTAIQYSLAHPQLFNIQHGDNPCYLESGDFERLKEELSFPSGTGIIFPIKSAAAHDTENNYLTTSSSDDFIIPFIYSSAYSRGGTDWSSRYIGAYNENSHEWYENFRNQFKNKTGTLYIWPVSLYPIIYTEFDNKYGFETDMSITEHVIPKWFFDKYYCIRN